MATGVSRATAEPPLIGGCQAGKMEAWASLRCSQRRCGGGPRQPPDPVSPLAPALGQAAGKPRAGGTVQDGHARVSCWWGPPVWLPSQLCWGQRQAWDTTRDPRPLQRAQRSRLLRGKVAAGRSQGSGEMLLGRGHCRRTSPHQAQDGRWGLGFASGLFIPQITCLLPSPHGYSSVGVALGQERGLGQGRGTAPHRDQPSCTLGNSLGQQT